MFALAASRRARTRTRTAQAPTAPASDETPRPELYALFRQATNEAAGLAWFTPYPLLVFSLACLRKKRALHQELVRQRSLELLAEAV